MLRLACSEDLAKEADISSKALLGVSFLAVASGNSGPSSEGNNGTHRGQGHSLLEWDHLLRVEAGLLGGLFGKRGRYQLQSVVGSQLLDRGNSGPSSEGNNGTHRGLDIIRSMLVIRRVVARGGR